jgi:uncharacterized protein (TIGR00730 family)
MTLEPNQQKLRSICVYCGASNGVDARYVDAAKALAAALVGAGIALVYGGGNVGLMGVIADEAMRLGGSVTGVIPTALMEKEVGHRAVTHLHVVADMHERKAKMAQLSDGFIALPGGMGTLEELFEMLTWSQLGFHDKPIGLLNVDGFYDGLIAFTGHLVAEGFLKPAHAALMMHEPEPQALLARFAAFTPDRSQKLLQHALAADLLR